MLIIFLGPPGSGKGTQAKIISASLHSKHISTGDMLREVAGSGTSLGNLIAEIMSSGKLVTDDLVNQIVQEILGKAENSANIILDGYPRTLEQAVFLDDIYTAKYLVINFQIDIDKLKQRVSRRFICKACGEIYNNALAPTKIDGVCDKCGSTEFISRADDNENALITRVEAYQQQIAKILKFYQARNNLYNVNADDTVENVAKHILEAVKNH